MARKQVVLVAESTVELGAVANAARERGFEIEHVIEEIATLVGSAEDGELAEIRHLPGVHSVEEERAVQLPSPDGDGPF